MTAPITARVDADRSPASDARMEAILDETDEYCRTHTMRLSHEEVTSYAHSGICSAWTCGSVSSEAVSGEFMSANGVKNVGSVTHAVNRLKEEDLVYEFAGEWKFTNPFFREWLNAQV